MSTSLLVVLFAVGLVTKKSRARGDKVIPRCDKVDCPVEGLALD